MEQEQLKKANELSREIDSLEALTDHFARYEDNRDSREEVMNILNSYDNLMSGVNREEAAKIMLDSYVKHIKDRLDHAKDEFDDL